MTAAELTCEVLDRRNILVKEKDYWSCWEVCDKEEMGETRGKKLKSGVGDIYNICPHYLFSCHVTILKDQSSVLCNFLPSFCFW